MQSFREFSDTIRELTDEEIMNVAGGTVPPSCTPQAMRNSAMVGAISFALPAAFFWRLPGYRRSGFRCFDRRTQSAHDVSR